MNWETKVLEDLSICISKSLRVMASGLVEGVSAH